MEDKFQVEVERREHYLFHCIQIQPRNVLTIFMLIVWNLIHSVEMS